MNINPNNNRLHHSSGFSLVEIMVGMVIALLGMIIIFQVFSVSEGIKRTTTSGGDAAQGGATALYVLDNSLKQAGYGVWSPATINNLNKLIINVGAANVPDSITLSYMPGYDFGPIIPSALVFPSAAAAAAAAVTTETLSIGFDAGGRPQLVSSVNGVIGEGIVMLKAQYGVDTNLDYAVDSWQTAAPPDLRDIVAIRHALVARSAQPEKPGAGGVCATTTSFPVWIGGVLQLDGNVGLAAGDDWKCYRYKTFENTVVLRNGRQ